MFHTLSPTIRSNHDQTTNPTHQNPPPARKIPNNTPKGKKHKRHTTHRQLSLGYAEERKVLVVNGIPGVPEDARLGAVLLVRQQLELDVGIAAGVVLAPSRQSLTPDDRHDQGVLLAEVAQLEDQLAEAAVVAVVAAVAVAGTAALGLAVARLLGLFRGVVAQLDHELTGAGTLVAVVVVVAGRRTLAVGLLAVLELGLVALVLDAQGYVGRRGRLHRAPCAWANFVFEYDILFLVLACF